MLSSVRPVDRKIRILVANAHGREWLGRLRGDPTLDFVVATEPSGVAGAVDDSGAEVVLLDATLPQTSLRTALSSTVKPCILLGSANLEDCVIPCLVDGARGHLADHDVPHKLREAVDTVL